MNYPTQGNSPVSHMPFTNAETTPMFPPIELKSHWDASMIFKRMIPQGASIALPLDPRPWTKVCLNYVNSGDAVEQAPAPPTNMVFPPGGKFYPPNRYLESIQNESLLRRLDRPLETAENKQWLPSVQSDMYVDGALVPERTFTQSQMVSEMAMPRALLRGGPYPCREEMDTVNIHRSTKLFNNATKQQRYEQSFPTKK